MCNFNNGEKTKNIMKVLWVNPMFLDYRVPFYSELNNLLQGNLHVAFSPSRIPQRCKIKLETAIGANAHALESETVIKFVNKKATFANRGVWIPVPRGLSQMLDKISVDIVISEGFFQWTPWSIMKAKRSRVPCLIAYECTEHTERFCPYWRRLYRKIIGGMCDGFLTNGTLSTYYLKNLLGKEIKTCSGVMAADSQSLARSVSSFSALERQSLRNDLLIDQRGLTYIFVGSFIERKGICHLLEAWIKHIDFFPFDNLLLVGDGALYDEYTSKYSKLNGVRFIGSVNYDDIHKYYAISDVFVIPTLEDNWSLVVPEAMACGLPIACSIYNGCYPELIQEDTNGKVFDPLDESSIVEVLRYFHHVDLKSMGMNSVNLEKEFSPVKCAHRAYQFIKSFCK